jgi:hypothetical protein
MLWFLNSYREKFHSQSVFILSTSGEDVLLKKFLWVGKHLSESSTCGTDLYQQDREKLFTRHDGCLSYGCYGEIAVGLQVNLNVSNYC